MGYAFISYSTKNQASADAMRELFNKHNIDTWMAPYDIPAGSKYAAVITKAIRDCSCFVLLLSNDSQASEAVDSEVELATLTFKKSIITVELEKVILNDAFTFYIHNKQIIAAHKIDEDSREIKQILEAVRAYTNVNDEKDINSDLKELREKYPDDITLLNKFLNTYFKQQESIFINNCDFEKRTDYINFFKKNFGENVSCVEMQKFLDEMISLLKERKSLDDFHAKYQECGVLLIDDFQFCFGKEATQETVYRILKYRAENNLSTIIFSQSEIQDLSIVTATYLYNLLETYEKVGIMTDRIDSAPAVVEKIEDSNSSADEENIETLKNDSNILKETDEIVLTIEQQTRLQSCACGYCGMSAQIKKDDSGYWVQCSHCDAVATIAESVDMALDNWATIMKEENTVARGNSFLDEANRTSDKTQESSDSDKINNSIAQIGAQGNQENNTVDSTTHGSVSGESAEPLKPKTKGHLVSSYRRAIVISKEDCVHPIEILMPDDTTKTFDFCDEFAVSNQKKYIVVRQKNESDEYLFFIFRSRNGKNTLISEGQDQKKVYRWFREKHTDEYTFTDDKVMIRNEKKKKHFAQDTAPRLFATADDIPQILVLPDKYEYISSNAFAKLNLDGKEIRQIIISDSVEVIEDNAFEGLIVTEAVHIPSSVKRIGDSAFTLKEGAYIYFSSLSRTSIAYPRQNAIVITDAPYKRAVAYEVEPILAEIAQSKNITRIKHQVLPRRSPSPVVDEIVIPDGVCVIDNSAFDNVKVSKRVVIPSSVTRIGKYSFDLLPDAYIECDATSYAYLYCQENGIRNSVDISNYYKSKGVCAYCGGRFSGLFKKKCGLCGKEKSY